MMDIVYNHTSRIPGSVRTNRSFSTKNRTGTFGNKMGDWGDVIDLDYKNRDLWDYQIETLCQWAELADGFRCDVAPLVPLEFWIEAEKRWKR